MRQESEPTTNRFRAFQGVAYAGDSTGAPHVEKAEHEGPLLLLEQVKNHARRGERAMQIVAQRTELPHKAFIGEAHDDHVQRAALQAGVSVNPKLLAT